MSQFLTLEGVACCLEKLTAKVAALESRVATLEAAAAVLGAANQVTLEGGSAFVANPSVDAETTVIFNRLTEGGTPGNLSYSVDPGVGITFMSDSLEDTSVIAFSIQP